MYTYSVYGVNMVQAMINIDEHSNKVLNVIKALYSLKNKSEAIDFMTKEYEERLLQSEFRPEFVEKFKKHLKTAKYKEYSSVKEFRKDVENSSS